jgi:hypothetical protein
MRMRQRRRPSLNDVAASGRARTPCSKAATKMAGMKVTKVARPLPTVTAA